MAKTLSGAPDIKTYDSTSAANLGRSLNREFESGEQYQGILNRYGQARQATSANTQATGQYITSVVQGNQDYEKLQGGIQKESALESRRGFATNVAALTNIQKQTDQRVKQLTDQANQALMANNAAGAQALSQLAVDEQTSLTNARTQFLNQYFATQQESRAQAGFRTPEQTAVIDLAKQYPGANISDGDSLADAQAKISASPLYQANLDKVKQDIEAVKAQAVLNSAQAQYLPEQVRAQLMQAAASQTSAGAAVIGAQAQQMMAGAQSEQTRFLTEMYKGGGTGGQAQDVSGLLNGSITPQSLQAKYANVPNGGLIVSNILSQAQGQGYNLNAGNLQGIGQETRTKTLNSGSWGGLSSIGLSISDALQAGGRLISGQGGAQQPTAPTGVSNLLYPKSGQTQTIGNVQYKFDGKNWVKQ